MHPSPDNQLEFLPGQAVTAAWWMNGIGTLIVVKEVHAMFLDIYAMIFPP